MSNPNNKYQRPPSTTQSQTHFLLSSPPEYKINPSILPRPNEFPDIYTNEESSSSIFETNNGTHPPHSTSKYIVKETSNSSCRLIRATFTKIPTSQSIISSSNLFFGLYVQPFAEIQEGEESIPKIPIQNDFILRCKRCYSYINSKYEMSYNKKNIPIAKCNICSYENELNSNSLKGYTNEYSANRSNYIELNKPTVDFQAPTLLTKNQHDFIPHYFVCIDITSFSYEMSFPTYVLNSFISNKEAFHNAEHSYISFVTFDDKSVQFYSIDKNNELSITYMNDIQSPFSPLSHDALFFKVTSPSLQILAEKVTLYIEHIRSTSKTSKVSVTSSAIQSGVAALSDVGGRVMIFTATQNKKRKDDKEELLNVLKESNKSMIAIDVFAFGDSTIDLEMLKEYPSNTGGTLKYYDINEGACIYEKIHYDISRVISRNNVYNVKMNIRYSIGVESTELFGSFGRLSNQNMAIPSCDADTSFVYHLRLTESFYENTPLHFQVVVYYTDNYNKSYLRLLNYEISTSSNFNDICTSCDSDAMIKAVFIKEAMYIPTLQMKEIRNSFVNGIVNLFYYYKRHTGKSNTAQLALPAQLKYLPLYANSFFKRGFLTKNNELFSNKNTITYLLYNLMKSPLYDTMLFLYPKLYSFDNFNEKKKLSADIIETDKVYINVDGVYVNLFIFDKVTEDFYQKFFGGFSFDECSTLTFCDESKVDINQDEVKYVLDFIEVIKHENIGNYLPLRIFFLTKENALHNKVFRNTLLEDRIDYESNYPEALYMMHLLIEKKFG